MLQDADDASSTGGVLFMMIAKTMPGAQEAQSEFASYESPISSSTRKLDADGNKTCRYQIQVWMDRRCPNQALLYQMQCRNSTDPKRTSAKTAQTSGLDYKL